MVKTKKITPETNFQPSWQAFFSIGGQIWHSSEDRWSREFAIEWRVGFFGVLSWFCFRIVSTSCATIRGFCLKPTSWIDASTEKRETCYLNFVHTPCSDEIVAKPARFQTINGTTSSEWWTWSSETYGGALLWGRPSWDGNAMAAPPEVATKPGVRNEFFMWRGFCDSITVWVCPQIANDPQGITKLFFAMNPSLVSRWAQLFSFLRLILIGPIDCLPQLGLRIDPSPNSPRVPPALCEQNTNFTQKWWLFPFNQGSLG